jgi:hypothetical protein
MDMEKISTNFPHELRTIANSYSGPLDAEKVREVLLGAARAIQQAHLVADRAESLCNKLSVLTWGQRELGLQEWMHLRDGLRFWHIRGGKFDL